MLRTRIATTVVALPPLVALVLVGGWPFAVLVAVALTIAAAEFLHVAGTPRTGLAIGLALTAALALASRADTDWRAAALIAAVVVPPLWPVFAARAATALHDWSTVTLAALYYGWLGSHAVLLRDAPDGRAWLLLGLFAAFATDTGAYFIGRSVGRHRLAPAISPRKTWEGALGGWLAGLAVVLVLWRVAELPLSAAEAAGLALVLPLVAELGDLAKSAVKRSLGVKDFGRIVPGHGGMADRIDSLLFALPLVFLWMRWFASS